MLKKIAGVIKGTSIPTSTPAPFEATRNDRIYATPQDYMRLILKSQGVKAKVVMHFFDEGKEIVLYVLSHQPIEFQKIMEIEQLLHQRIPKESGCKKPRYVFWAFGNENEISAA